MPPKSPSPNPRLTSSQCIGFGFPECGKRVERVVTWLDERKLCLCAQCYRDGLRFFRLGYEDAVVRYRAYRTARVVKGKTNPRK